MAEIINERIQKLKSEMAKKNLDSVLITDLKNVFYYSGYTGSSAYLVITLEKLYIVTDFRYITQVKSQCPLYEIVNVGENNVNEIFSSLKNTGFENLSISYNNFLKFEKVFNNLVKLDDLILKFRSIKSQDEIDNIKKAVEIADKAFLHILNYAKEGMSEIEIANEIDFFMKKNGAQANSFDTICASGIRGALPHGFPTEKKIKSKELVVLDFGCIYNGYCSDMTRTFGVGEVSKEIKDVYDTVLDAQLSALEMLKENVKCCDVHNVAQTIIDKKYFGYFKHALGHGVGLDIHEQPTLSIKSDYPLVTGNIVTVEPGIYIPDFCGVRIEDLVLITNNGVEIFTKSSKELKII